MTTLQHLSNFGVNHGTNAEGTREFSYRLFSDTWVVAKLTEKEFKSFQRRHKVDDLDELDFTHVLKMPNREIVCE